MVAAAGFAAAGGGGAGVPPRLPPPPFFLLGGTYAAQSRTSVHLSRAKVKVSASLVKTPVGWEGLPRASIMLTVERIKAEERRMARPWTRRSSAGHAPRDHAEQIRVCARDGSRHARIEQDRKGLVEGEDAIDGVEEALDVGGLDRRLGEAHDHPWQRELRVLLERDRPKPKLHRSKEERLVRALRQRRGVGRRHAAAAEAATEGRHAGGEAPEG